MNGITKTAATKARLQKTYGYEEVFVVPSFDTDNLPNGFTHKKVAEKKHYGLNLINAKFILRSDAEKDNILKQIVPMTVIKDSYQNYFVIKRENQPKENRLEAKYSALIGGHIKPVDGYTDNFERCLFRHLRKDTTFTTIPHFGRSFYGYIKDEKSNLSDHLGYIFFTTVTNCYKQNLKTRPSANISGQWMSKDQIMSDFGKFDSWSRLVMSYIAFEDGKGYFRWKQTPAQESSKGEQNQ